MMGATELNLNRNQNLEKLQKEPFNPFNG